MRFDHVTVLAEDFVGAVNRYRLLDVAEVSRPAPYGFTEIMFGDSEVGLFDLHSFSELAGVDIAATTASRAILQFTSEDVPEDFASLVKGGFTPLYAPRRMPWGAMSALLLDPAGALFELYDWSAPEDE